MNLVYEPEGRIQVLEQISALVNSHTEKVNCKCEMCRKATQIGQQIRYSPKVTKILVKGDSITTSDIQYLLSREVPVTEIAKVTGLNKEDILQIPFNGEPIVKERKSPVTEIPFTLEEYEKLKKVMPLSDIAAMYDVTRVTIYNWAIKLKRTSRKQEIEGLSREKYRDYKVSGFKDTEIRKMVGVSSNRLQAWKEQNFSKEEIREINAMMLGRNARKKAN